MTIVRLTRTYPRTAMPGAGLHAYYYTRMIDAHTIIFTKGAPSPVTDVPAHAELVEVNYSDLNFGKRRELLKLPFILGSKLYGDARFIVSTTRFLLKRRTSVQLIHLHTHTYIFTALLLKKIFGAPIVVGFHGTDLLRLECHRGLLPFLRQADLLLYVSAAMKDRLAELFPGKPAIYTGNFVDLSFFAPADAAREKVLVAIGNLRWQKDYPTLLHAFAGSGARRGGYRLVIAGEGPDRPQIEAKIAELGLGGEVTLLGMCSRERIRELLQTSRALVLSSVSEGFPKVIIEAMACGTPVVATDAGDCRNVIGAAGITVPPGEPSALAEAMSAIALDDECFQRHASAAQAQASLFSTDSMISRVKSAYSLLL